MTVRSQRSKREIYGAGRVVLSSLSPNTGVRSTSTTINVIGTGFLASDVIVWNGSPVATTFINMGQLVTSSTVALPASAGTVPVLVRRGSGDSNTLTFTVT
jgi:IPT/TIG domain-containing protein